MRIHFMKLFVVALKFKTRLNRTFTSVLLRHNQIHVRLTAEGAKNDIFVPSREADVNKVGQRQNRPQRSKIEQVN